MTRYAIVLHSLTVALYYLFPASCATSTQRHHRSLYYPPFHSTQCPHCWSSPQPLSASPLFLRHSPVKRQIFDLLFQQVLFLVRVHQYNQSLLSAINLDALEYEIFWGIGCVLCSRHVLATSNVSQLAYRHSRLVCSVMHGLVHVQCIRVTAEAIRHLWQPSLNNK